ncbi:MAG: D-2-hydroxyacid dehydrogenase [Gaiellaceae bacterium]
MQRVTVAIATPIERELVERIRRVDERLDVLFEPDLLPPPRYPSDHGGEPGFTRTPEQEERFAQIVAGAEVALGFPGESAAGLAWLVRTAPHLRFVQCMYAGAGQQVRAANLSPSELDRVAFASSSGVHAVPLAEWSLFGILALTKGLPRLLRDKRDRRWDHYPVRELPGKTLLVVGFGEIGREVARLAEAFGMRVVAIKRTADHTAAGPERLHELVAEADAIVVTLPLTDETRGLIGREALAGIRDGAILVNVGRGAVVDEGALVDALTSGKLAGAALDVFAEEPLPASSPLWELENVILSPHTAALSLRENERIVELFADNLGRYLRGDELRSRIRTSVYY